MAPTPKEQVICCGGEQFTNTYLLSTMKCLLHIIRKAKEGCGASEWWEERDERRPSRGWQFQLDLGDHRMGLVWCLS